MDHLYSSYIKRLAPDTLKKWLKDKKENLIIVDVRDSDYKYVSIHASDLIIVYSTDDKAHISGSVHIPSVEFGEESSQQLLSKYPLNTSPTFVFHCMRSQQRGPSCSRKFLRYLLLKTECKDDINLLPKIYLLDGGLKKWNQLYGDDESLMVPIDD